METVSTDVAIIGAGGAGLRAALALAEAAPKLRIALISKVYPMRSHTCAAEGGAAGVIKPDDSLEHHFNDTVGGGDWLCDQDAVQYLVQEAPKELVQLEHWGWHALAAHWAAKLALAGVVFLSLWSAAHRLRITAYDLGLRADALVAAVVYSAALTCTGAAIYYLLRI